MLEQVRTSIINALSVNLFQMDWMWGDLIAGVLLLAPPPPN